MPQWRESQHWYLGLTGSQIGDLFLKDRTREGVDSYWSKWRKWEQSACESSFNLWHVEKNKLLTVSPGNHAIMQEGGTASICMHPTCNATRMVLKGWSPPPHTKRENSDCIFPPVNYAAFASWYCVQCQPCSSSFCLFFCLFFLPNLQHASYDLQQISSRTHNCICDLQAFVKRVHKGARDLWANAEVACCNSNSMIISGECNDLFCLCITVRVVLLFRVCCVLPVCLVASVCYSSSLCIVWNIYLLAMSFM